MTGLTVYQVYERSQYYASRPIAVVVTESDQEFATMPAMVICPPGQFRASMASMRAYGRSYSSLNGWVNSDLFNFEQFREAFTSYFQQTNISITNSDIDNLIQDLATISMELSKNPSRQELSFIFDRLNNISKSLQNSFPILAPLLSTKEPVPNGFISLNANNSIRTTDSNGYAKYRELNGLYDDCAIYSLADKSLKEHKEFADWNKTVGDIMKCRLGDAIDTSCILRDLMNFASYPRLVNLARPSLTDIVLDCKWFNSKFSARYQNCDVKPVWTPFGKCFRIASKEGINLSMTSPQSSAYVNVLIDTLSAEFPDGQTKVYFYSQDETEFAATSGGIPIKPGLESDLMIEQIRKSQRTQKNCGSTKLKYFKSYSRDKCVWEKQTEPVEEKCNCLYDRSPNYFQDTIEEVAKMEANLSYVSSLNFCSMIDTLFCAPKALSSDYDCPADCEETQPEVSFVTNVLDPRKTFTRLPPKFDEKTSDYMQSLSRYGGYLKAPGSDQLNTLLSELFEKHMTLISTFWWRNRTEFEPFYVVWFINDLSYDVLMNNVNTYFGGDNSPTSLLPFDFDSKIFGMNEEIYFSSFIELITNIIVKYNKFHYNWTYSYSKEVVEPYHRMLINDLAIANNSTDAFAKMRLSVLNKFAAEHKLFYECITLSEQRRYKCYTDYTCDKKSFGERLYYFSLQSSDQELAEQLDFNRTLAKDWAPLSICDLEMMMQELYFYSKNFSISPARKLKIMLDELTSAGNSTSLWAAPWSNYSAWFQSEISRRKLARISSLAEALSVNANHSDIYEITNMYRDGSSKREYLKKAHVLVANAMEDLLAPLREIKECSLTTPLLWPDYDDPEDVNDKHYLSVNYLSILYREPDQQKLLWNVYNSVTTTLTAILNMIIPFAEGGRVFSISQGGLSTNWFNDFTYLIDNVFDIYLDGGRAYQKASLAEINLSFRAFRLRMIEEQEAYNI